MSDTSNAQAIGDAQSALAGAEAELALRREMARVNPTAANLAAVTALEERVATDQSNLAALMQALPRPVVVTSPTGVPASPPAAGTAPAPPSPSPAPTTIYTPVPLPPPVGTGAGGGVTSTGGSVSAPTPLYPGGPSVNPPASGGGGGGAGTSPLGPGAPSIGDGTGKLTATDILKLLGANFLGAAAGPTAGTVDAFGSGPSEVNDAWDYLRGVVDTEFTHLESAFETIGLSPVEAGTAVSVTEVGLGVAADIEAVDVVGLALFVLATEYAFGWLVTKVAAIFPNPSLFGWHPLGFIVDGLNSLGHQFERSAKDLSAPVVHLFTTPIRQLLGLFQRAANATASAHNKIAHVINDLTPALIHTAVVDTRNYAHELVADVTTTAQTYTDTAIHAVEHTLTTTEHDLKDFVTKSISDTLTPIHDAVNLLTNELAPIITLGAGVLVGEVATNTRNLKKLTTKVDTCTIDNCDESKPNNVHNVIKSLLSSLTAAGEIGFIAEAAANPLGTAAALAPLLEGIDTAAQDTFHALFGEL